MVKGPDWNLDSWLSDACARPLGGSLFTMDGKEGRAWESESRHTLLGHYVLKPRSGVYVCVCVPLWMTLAKCPCLSVPRKQGQHNQGPQGEALGGVLCRATRSPHRAKTHSTSNWAWRQILPWGPSLHSPEPAQLCCHRRVVAAPWSATFKATSA